MIDQYDQYIREHLQEMKETLRSLVQCPSVRGASSSGAPFGKDAADALQVFLDTAQSLGFETKNVDGYVGTVQLGDDPQLGILCHLDVVPAGNGWSVPPFDVTEQDGFLLGRGVIDDKGPAVAALYALKAVSESGIPLSGVRIIAGCDEENDHSDIDYYLQQESFPPMLFTPDADFPLINIEKGRVHATLSTRLEPTAAPRAILSLDAGEAVNAVPDKAVGVIRGFDAEEVRSYIDKTPLEGISFEIEPEDDYLRITAHGKSAHASTPEQGINALTGLLTLLDAMPIGCSDDTDCIHGLCTLFPFGETDGTDAGVGCADEESGALTLAFSRIRMDEDQCVAEVDIRFPICRTKHDIFRTLSKSAERFGLDVTYTGADPHYVPTTSFLVKTLLGVYEEVTGDPGKPLAIGGGTYVHGYEGGVAFGAEFPGDDNHMHGADERLNIENWIETAVIYARAIEKLCSKNNE